MSGRHPPVAVVGVVAFVVAAILAATLAPLFAYTTSLACFGLAHVLVELRYVDGRFGRRLPAGLWWSSGIGIIGIVTLRALRLGGVLVEQATTLELVLVAILVVVGVVYASGARSRVVGMDGVVGVVGASAIVVGAVTAPIETLLTLALLHNLTPLGFVVERAAPSARRRTVAVAGLIFVGAPLLVATGIPTALFAGAVDIERSFFNAGDLSRHLGVYLWPAWQHDDVAVARFSAAVCAQLLHYGAVLIWLPRALGDDDAPRLPWPRWSALVGAVVVLGAGLAVHFAVDFAGARAAYSLPAAVHAWLELPVLLVSLSALGGAVSGTTGPSPAPSRS
jgi:hypothetical protein